MSIRASWFCVATSGFRLTLFRVFLAVALVAICAAWACSLRSHSPGWMSIPTATIFTVFIAVRSDKRVATRLAFGLLSFVGFCFVAYYATGVGWLVVRRQDENVWGADGLFICLVFLLPGVITVSILLIRGFVNALHHSSPGKRDPTN